jgi:Arc/MetJ-type ribon-helix-helix transcriptional regulator
MNVRLDPRSEHLIEQQLRAGRFNTPEEVVARALETLAGNETALLEENDRQQAVRDMLDFAGKHRFTLGEGLRIRDLIHEGHKY